MITVPVRKHRMTQEQRDEAQAETDAAAPASRSESHEDTLAKTDELLDEIDEALEGLDTDQLRNFEQKGGQ